MVDLGGGCVSRAIKNGPQHPRGKRASDSRLEQEKAGGRSDDAQSLCQGVTVLKEYSLGSLNVHTSGFLRGYLSGSSA